MKILFITKELPYPVNSGARMRTWHYIRGLARAGETHVICGGTLEDNREGAAQLRALGVDPVFVPVRPAPVWLNRLTGLVSPLPYAVLLRRSAALTEAVRSIARSARPDLVVCDGIHLAPNIPEDLTCPTILDEHNVESVIIGRYAATERNPAARLYAWLEWFKFCRLEERLWPRFTTVHVCSAVDQRMVETRSRHPDVVVIPNGVSAAEADQALARHPRPAAGTDRPRPWRVTYSGLMGWRPNDDAALYFCREIWPLVARGAGNRLLQCYIVGRGPSREVQRLTEADPRITVTGEVADVAPYIIASDAVVVPLRIGSGTRLKILEAMALGVPVVSTSVGCEGLDVTHDNNILIADTPEAFAAAVGRLRDNADLGARLAANGRALIERQYDWPLIEAMIQGEALGFARASDRGEGR